MFRNMLGDRLKKLRVQAGLTQRVFADALSVSSSAVSKWENGKNEPDTEMLLKIAEYYGISIEELLTGELKKSEFIDDKVDSEKEESSRKKEIQNNKNEILARKKEPLHKENRIKWLGLGIALGCVITVVLSLTGIILWKIWRWNGDAFSYEIVAARYTEDVNWGEVYEVSVFYSGELFKECEDKVIDDIMTQWEKGSLCHEKVELITVICNNDKEMAENFEKVYQSIIFYLAPYNMDYFK